MTRGSFEQSRQQTDINAPVQAPLNKMKKVRTFNPGRLPPLEMQQFTSDINTLVDQYNETDVLQDKKAFLKDIQEKIRLVEYKFPASYIANSPQFLQVSAELFREIQYQFASLGVHSVLDTQSTSSPLAEVIANMSPDKADRLFEGLLILRGGNLSLKLSTLYSKEDMSPEANRFRDFLGNHTIEFLGGGNSTNFKVTGKDGRSEVLKIDNRLDMPKRAEAHLRDILGDLFTEVMTERVVSCPNPKGRDMISRTIQVNEFCSGGSVFEHGRRSNKSWDDLIGNTGILFEQMAGALLGVQEAGCFFPDAKITNWLVDDGKVRIADTKSFVFADGQGKFVRGLPANQYGNFLTTEAYSPPEFERRGEYDVDSAHAFMLGKNLYLYAARREWIAGHDAAGFDFSGAVFQTDRGKKYKALILALVKPEPEARMSVSGAYIELFKINNPSYKDIFTELQKLKFGTNDKVMDKYILDKIRQIKAATSDDEIQKILSEINETVLALQADKAANEVRNIIGDFRNKAGLFSIGMNAKADRIENAMAGVSIEDRKNLLKSDASSAVLAALASHRHFGKSGDVYLNEKGKIDTNQAAQSFKDFKARFAKEMTENSKDQDETLSNSPGPGRVS